MKILHLATTPSTMAEARALLAAGDTHTQAVLANTQTAGRGRLGRTWHTFGAPYSMACTYIVRQGCAHLPLVASLAVLEGINEALKEETVILSNAKDPGLLYTRHLSIKWPNDILLHHPEIQQTQADLGPSLPLRMTGKGKKVAGILCEGLTLECFLVGIGLNLQAPPEIPADFPGTFLNTTQTPEDLAKSIGACLFKALALYREQGWAAFHHNYAHACSIFGQHIIWRGGAGDTELTGLARGLTQQGHLELVADDGTVHIIPSGEIVAQGNAAKPTLAPTAK